MVALSVVRVLKKIKVERAKRKQKWICRRVECFTWGGQGKPHWEDVVDTHATRWGRILRRVQGKSLALAMCFLCPGSNTENNMDDLQWQGDSGYVNRVGRKQILWDPESQYSFYVWWKILEELGAKKWYIQMKRISWTNSLESSIRTLKVE